MSDGTYEYHRVICDVDWLESQPDFYQYVVWYNK